MKISITEEQKRDLELLHRHEDDGKVRDRIKAVLLKSEDWTNKAIAQALRIHEETVRQHLTDWNLDKKLQTESGGSWSRLNKTQTAEIIAHIDQKIYTKAIDICSYIYNNYKINYTVSGLTKWLKNQNFSYKQPKVTPSKACPIKQEIFIKHYLNLLEETKSTEPIVFIDSVHPTMATKISAGWIRKGLDKPIAQSASRTRVNIIGSIELKSMQTVSAFKNTVNSEEIIAFLKQLKSVYKGAPKIHVILDNSGYHTSQIVRDFALKESIILHFLPPYSPNLNPIERLWKVMNEHVRNNRFFKSAKDFRETIAQFFEVRLPAISHTLRNRINDNFQTIKTVF